MKTILQFFFILSLAFLLINCTKKNIANTTPLQNKIYTIVDSMSDSYPPNYIVNFYIVSHQKKCNREFIRISTAKYFNIDSVSDCKKFKNKLIVFYSKKYFKNNKKITYLDDSFRYRKNTLSLYHSRILIFEIIDKNRFKNISELNSIKMNLFEYEDRNPVKLIVPPLPTNR